MITTFSISDGTPAFTGRTHQSLGALAIHTKSGDIGYAFSSLLRRLAVEFNLFGSFEGFVHIPFDRVGNMLLAIGCDFERPSNRAGA